MSTQESNKPMILVKASLEGELRRFSLERPVAYGELFEKVQLVFGLNDVVAMQYLDDEGDYVGVSSDFELEEALRLCESSKGGKLVRIKVVRLTKRSGQQEQVQQRDHSVDLRVKKLKAQLKEQRIGVKQKLRQKVQLERLRLKECLKGKKCAFKKETKKVRQQSKVQVQQSKKKMKEQIKMFKQQLRQEKLWFHQQVKTMKQQFIDQHRQDLKKLKAQQRQLTGLLLAQNQQQPALQREKVEQPQEHQTINTEPMTIQHEPPQQSKFLLSQLQFDPLQLRNMISGDVRLMKLLHKAINKPLHMESKLKKKAQKEAKKKQKKDKNCLEVA